MDRYIPGSVLIPEETSGPLMVRESTYSELLGASRGIQLDRAAVVEKRVAFMDGKGRPMNRLLAAALDLSVWQRTTGSFGVGKAACYEARLR
jgi:hypothetical protein